jgi:4-amino-4-deoxy-L-arabinose transferase-like glycosyltransferase
LVGWALIIGSIISYGYLLFPVRFFEAAWEFETMGALVDNSLLCLLGMGLVFHAREPVLKMQKLIALRVLLAVGCLVGLAYLMMVPLALSNERRLGETLAQQSAATGDLYADRLAKIQATLKKVKTIQELKTLGTMLNFVPTPTEIKELRLDEDFDRLQQWSERQINSRLNKQKQEAQQLIERNLAKLQKDCIRIVAGAILAAICYLLLFSMNLALFREYVVEPENPRREN